jgi:lipopolysaccharide export system protein LptA
LEEIQDLRKFAPHLKPVRHIAPLLRHAFVGILALTLWGMGRTYAQVTQPESADSTSGQVQGPQRKDVEIISTDVFHFAKFGPDSVSIRKLIGHVRLRQDSTYIDCDSAFQFLDTNLVIANGHVLITMPQNRTIKSQHLIYNGESKLLTLEKDVQLTDSSITLYTDRLLYYREPNYGEYITGGRIVQKENVLTSKRGYYYPDRSMAYFQQSVKLVNPDYTLDTDTLGYNTDTGIAFFLAPTQVKDSVNTMYTEDGYFDTENDFAFLHTNPHIGDTTYTLFADTIQYDQKKDLGKAIGHVRAEQKDSSLTLFGKYAEFQSKTERTFITDSTFAVQFMEDDTLYLWADTLHTYTDTTTDKRYFFAHYNTHIYMRDMQGICDSLAYWYDDSLLFLYQGPVMYSDESQITGDTVAIIMKDGTVDSMSIPLNPFIAMQEDTVGFDQIKGGRLAAKFKDKDLDKMWLWDNSESIYYTQDDSKQYMGMNRAKCSDMFIQFKDNKPNSILFQTNPEGTFFPIHKVLYENNTLEGFKWRALDRPAKPLWMEALIIKRYGVVDTLAQDLKAFNTTLDALDNQLNMLFGLAFPAPFDSTAYLDSIAQANDTVPGLDSLTTRDSLPGVDAFPIDTVPTGKPKGLGAAAAEEDYSYQNAGNKRYTPAVKKERRSLRAWLSRLRDYKAKYSAVSLMKQVYQTLLAPKPNKDKSAKSKENTMSKRAAERAAKRLERQIARVKGIADREADKRMGRADKAYRKSLRHIHPKRIRFFNPRRLDQD